MRTSSLTLACVTSLLSLCGHAAEPPQPRFRPIEVDTQVQIGYGVAVADVDGDKRVDILLADKNLIVWYQNPNWKKHVITEKLTEKDHVCLAAADIDGDGKAEVAVGAEWNPGDTQGSGAVFYLIAPQDRTQKWEAVKLTHEPTVHRMRWVRNAEGRQDLVVVPLHGRGNNPATGEGSGVRILGYQRPADPKGTWKTELLDDTLHKTHNFDPVSTGLGAQQILIAGKEGVFSLDRSSWIGELRQLSGTESGGAGEVRHGKLTGGRKFFATVEPMHGTNLVVYTEPTGRSESGRWRRNVLDTSLVDGHALGCGDFLGIGGDQVVVGWRAMNRPGVKVGIKLFTPLDPNGDKWRETLVDDNEMACEDLALADFNADGRLDIVAAGRATKNLKIYFNEGQR